MPPKRKIQTNDKCMICINKYRAFGQGLLPHKGEDFPAFQYSKERQNLPPGYFLPVSHRCLPIIVSPK